MKTQYLYTIICIGVTLLFTSKGYTQPRQSYVITNQNDTVTCNIKKPLLFDDFGNGYKYRLTKKDSYKSLSPDSIKAYYLAEDSVTYIAEPLPGNKKLRFVTLLEHGKINLYQDKAQSSGRNSLNTWYASKSGAHLFEIKTEGVTIGGSGNSRDERKKALSDLLSEDPPVAQNFAQKNDFSFKAIRDAIVQYNADIK
jgi:hypothetical protein